MKQTLHVELPSHPYGIQPRGNMLMSTKSEICRDSAILQLPDEMLLYVLRFLIPSALLNFAWTCKFALHASFQEELWKRILLKYVILSKLLSQN